MRIILGDQLFSESLLQEKIFNSFNIDINIFFHTFISHNETNQLINLLKTIRKIQISVSKRCCIDIYFFMDEVESFDHTFFIILRLLDKMKKSNKVRIGNIYINNQDDNPTYFKLKQLQFELNSGKPLYSLRSNRFSINNVSEQYSKDFLPLLEINKRSYQNYFKSTFLEQLSTFNSKSNKIGFKKRFNSLLNHNLKSFSKKQSSSTVLFKTIKNILDENKFISPNINNLIFYNVFFTIERIKAFPLIFFNKKFSNNFAIFDEINFISNEDIRFYLRLEKNLGIQNIKKNEQGKYLKKVANRLEKLFTRPPYHVLIFTFLFQNKFNGVPFSETNIINQFDQILAFTDNLYYGLHELVKNILDHTESVVSG